MSLTDQLLQVDENGCDVGRKRWKLLPPQHTPLLMDRFAREMAPSFDTSNAGSQYPNLAKAAELVIEIEQVIFIHPCLTVSLGAVPDNPSLIFHLKMIRCFTAIWDLFSAYGAAKSKSCLTQQ